MVYRPIPIIISSNEGPIWISMSIIVISIQSLTSISMFRIIEPCIYFPSKSISNSINAKITTITSNLISVSFIEDKTYSVGNSCKTRIAGNLTKINCSINLKIISYINRSIKSNISRLKRTVRYSLNTRVFIIVIICTTILVKIFIKVIFINYYFTGNSIFLI